MSARFSRVLWFVVPVAWLAGCGGRELPELAPVTGKVTLDGKPLEGVLVSFYPQGGDGGGGRPATGVTDAEGNYELQYIEGEEGAKIGMNRVEVTTIWPEGEPPPGARDQVPSKYNTNSTLTFEVKEGEDNVFNIEMTSN